MELLKTLIIYSLAILTIIFMYYVYQTREIKKRNNRPIYYDFKDFDLICPNDYYYSGSKNGKDICKSIYSKVKDKDGKEITKEYPSIVHNGKLMELENIMNTNKINARCRDKTVTFSAVKPFCKNN